MTHETELIDVPEQHSIDKVLFGDSIDADRVCVDGGYNRCF